MTVQLVHARDDRAATYTAILRAVTAGGTDWLSAVQAALAALTLLGEPTDLATLTVASDASGVRVTIEGGTGSCADLPAGLCADCAEHPRAAGGTSRHVVVTGAPEAGGVTPLATAIAAGCDPARLLDATLRTVVEQARRLAAADAETRDLRTELDETNHGLMAVYDELHAANQRLADLVAMLSHDVRQPLTIITTCGAFLMQEWDNLDDAERRGDVARLAAAGNRMAQFVEEILTLTQLDGAGLCPRPAPVKVDAAITEALAGIVTTETAAVIVADGPGQVAIVDPRHLQQILTNLLSNALKYGAPPVEISTAATPDGVEITVRDHGEGVPDDFQPRLFDRFARADTAVTRAKKGTGLGLYIVRQLAEANGGTITYRNHPEGGGCFTVRLRHPSDARPERLDN